MSLAIASSALSLVQRWYSAKIGEGLIYDLRVALFDHVQRLPLSFFTRTQTGALMSRMNNDVIGAQQAVTNTLGTVVSNIITLDRDAQRSCSPSTGGSRSSPCSCCRSSSSRRERIGTKLQWLTRGGHAAQRVDEQHGGRALQRRPARSW